VNKTVGVGVIGFGTVGAGTIEILLKNSDLIQKHTGFPIELKKVADLDIKTDRGIALPTGILSTDSKALIADPEVDIVVELIGGYEPAATFIREALNNGKYVVTANKALLATQGWELFEAAEKNGVSIGFEASVGGGIPILRSIREGLCANNLHSIHGILNGTANYILSRMSLENMDFEDVLRRPSKKDMRRPIPVLTSRESMPRTKSLF